MVRPWDDSWWISSSSFFVLHVKLLDQFAVGPVDHHRARRSMVKMGGERAVRGGKGRKGKEKQEKKKKEIRFLKARFQLRG
jgi:hypothetical protein